MALKATIFKIELNVADMDRGYHESHALTTGDWSRQWLSASATTHLSARSRAVWLSRDLQRCAAA